jgi:hypothetical protein
VAPAAGMVAVDGETAMAVRVFAAAAMVRVALPLILPMVAITVVDPAATAFAMPDGLIVATAAFASVQVAVAVTSAVDPSLYVPVAVNCSAAPIEISAVAGDVAIAVSVFVGLMEPDAAPPQPILASSSERQRERTREDRYL